MALIWAHLCLVADIWSIELLRAMFGRNGEVLDSHLFFFDRYSDFRLPPLEGADGESREARRHCGSSLRRRAR